jgi:Fic family protein
MTLRRFAEAPDSIPLQATWYLADLGQALGRQELFTRQAPQKLKVLRDRALAESAVSSNRIEGVEVEQDQVATLVFGHRKPRNRDEEELRGFEGRLGEIRDERGAKTGLVEAYVESREGHFTLGEVEQACPGVSRDMVRRVLDNLRKADRIRCVTRGRSARWIRIA